MDSNKKNYYDSYINNIIKNTKLSEKDNSLLISLELIKEDCICNVELVDQNGFKQELNNLVFANTEDFRTYFLQKLVKDYYDSLKVVVVDAVDVDGDNTYAFRMVSDKNDMFTIDGLSEKDAIKLKKFLKDSKEEVVNKDDKLPLDEDGLSTIFGIILALLIVVTVIFLFTIFR